MDGGGQRSDVHFLVNTVSFLSHIALCRREAMLRPPGGSDGAGGEAEGHTNASPDSSADSPVLTPTAGAPGLNCAVA